FFQAEDGIRDFHVTGVQTCALPICLGIALVDPCLAMHIQPAGVVYRPLDSYVPYIFGAVTQGEQPPTPEVQRVIDGVRDYAFRRSEERRVGNECGYRRWAIRRMQVE